MTAIVNLADRQLETVIKQIEKGALYNSTRIKTVQLTKFIILLLGNKNNEPVSLTCLQLEMYILHKIFPELSLELNYQNNNPYNDILISHIGSLVVKGIVQYGDGLVLADDGLDQYRGYKETSTKEELKVTKDFKDLFNDLTLDELWALVYFSHPELKIEDHIYDKIASKRKELAYSMYRKNKLTLSKTAQIADKYLGDVMNELA